MEEHRQKQMYREKRKNVAESTTQRSAVRSSPKTGAHKYHEKTCEDCQRSQNEHHVLRAPSVGKEDRPKELYEEE